jgi:hypothetical protein
MIKKARLLITGISACCLYVMLTGFDSSTSNPATAATPVDNTSPPDTTDLEKPPNLTIPEPSIEKANLAIEPTLPEPIQTLAVVKPPPHPTEISINKPLDTKPEVKETLVIDQDINQTALDLSIPFKANSESNTVNDPNSSSTQNQSATIFTPESKKKARAIRVDGSVLMTQEQETEKRRSLDGAGITINVKP